MLFHTLRFLCFFLIVYILYRILSHKGQNRMLLLASYVFYAGWDWRFLALIWISTTVDYFCGIKIHSSSGAKQRRGFLALSLVTNLSLLGFFKYFNFFTSNFKDLVSLLGWHPDIVYLKVILPVGISFYTFQTLSYTIDIYRNKIEPERDFLDFALFVAFFPQLVAGPIERAKNLLPQFKMPRAITKSMVKEGIWLILYGLFLKIFVADNMARVADSVFSAAPASLSGGESLMGIYAFAFQIFGDFAGYSSMAIGIAKLFGINLMTNFLYPYLVTNPRDFWRNWHISLSTWLRDYLYISLGGNRNGRFRTYRNIFITMTLGGLWHGAAWTFVVWGIYQGCVLIIHRFFTENVKTTGTPNVMMPVWFLIRVVFMFHVTCFGWLIFRAQSLAQVGAMCRNIIVNFGSVQNIIPYGSAMIFYIWFSIVIQLIQKRKNDHLAVQSLPYFFRYAVYVFICITLIFAIGVSISTSGRFQGQSFIYFQF